MSSALACSTPVVASVSRRHATTTSAAATRPLASSAFKAGAALAFFGSSVGLRSAAPRGAVASRAPRQVTTCASKGASLPLLHPLRPNPGRLLCARLGSHWKPWVGYRARRWDQSRRTGADSTAELALGQSTASG